MISASFWGPESMQNEVRKRIGNENGNKRAHDCPKTATRRPKTPQGLQVGADLVPRGVQNRFEIDQNSILGAQRSSKATEDPPETPNRPQMDAKLIHNRREVGMQKILEIDVFRCFSTQALATWPETKLY